jgi:MYXO-CTERM domain-containing protein
MDEGRACGAPAGAPPSRGGAAVTLLVAAFGVWWIRRRTN